MSIGDLSLAGVNAERFIWDEASRNVMAFVCECVPVCVNIALCVLSAGDPRAAGSSL